MKKWMTGAVLAAGLVAGEAAAQETAPTTATRSEVITSQPRTGLFGRRTARRETVITTVQPGTVVQQAQFTEPAAPMQTEIVPMQQEYRGGLMSRLRGRLGR